MSGLTTPETSSTPHQEHAQLRAEAADIAAAPFNRPSADVVFLTADNVEYHLHKIVLSLASPFFEDMFTLTQPSAELSGIVSNDERIRIEEDSETFGSVMRLLYPVADPPLTDRLRIEQMLEVALKYQLQEAIEILKAAWRIFIPLCPLQILAKACHLRLKEEVEMAAGQWKTQAVWSTHTTETNFGRTLCGVSYVPEMAQLSAGFFFRFLRFLKTPSDAVPELLDPPQSTCRVKDATLPSHITSRVGKEPNLKTSLNASQSEPDILLHCRVDDVDVPAHEIVIRLASAQNLLACASVSTSLSGRTIYTVDADSRPLQVLLHICYPFPTVNLCEVIDLLDEIMSLAKRYRVSKAINYIKERFHTVGQTRESSLTCYFLARKWGWTEEASSIVKYICKSGMFAKYSHAMESSTAEEYADLLKQCFVRRSKDRKLRGNHAK